jgi:hypothetical protein
LQRVSHTYNTYNQRTQELNQEWNKAGYWNNLVEDQLFKYYYEEYTLNIDEKALAQGTAQVYPIPANSIINLMAKWDLAQNFTTKIYDIQGKLLMQWNVANTSQYSTILDVSNFASGSYIVEFRGSNSPQSIKQKFNVVH